MAAVSDVVSKLQFVQPQEKLSRVLPMLARNRTRVVGVGNPREFLGIIDDRCLRDFNHPPSSTNAEAAAFSPGVITKENTPEEVVQLFLDGMASAIPYSTGNGVVDCVIHRNQVLRLAAESSRVKAATVAEYYSHADAVVPENTTIAVTRSKMRDIGVHHMMLTGPGGAFKGVLSTFDIVTKALPQSDEPRTSRTGARTDVFNSPAASIASMQPVTISPQAKLSDAFKRMLESNVTCLAVVDNGKPYGLLTVRDALHAVLVTKAEPVMVYGLRDDEKSMKPSITSLGAAFLEKLGRRVNADYLALHVKSVVEGKKRRYVVKGKLSIDGKIYTASTPEASGHKGIWEPNTAVKEILDELGRVASDRAHSRPRTLEKARGADKRRNGEPQE